MTKATATARRSAICAGTVGLAVIGAVPAAHAADAGGAGITAQPMLSLRGLLSGDDTRLGLDKLPVVGTVPDMLAKMPVSVVPPVVPAMLKSPGARSRPLAAPPAPGGLGVLPLASNLPIDTDKTEELLAQLTGKLGGLGPLSALTGGLGGVAAL